MNIFEWENETVLIKNTLIVKDKDKFIVYCPFTNKITKLDVFPLENQDIFNELSKNGFFGELPITVKYDSGWTDFKSLTLLLTRRCNLDCIYCYAGYNERPSVSMSEKIALSSIDWFVRQLKTEIIRLTFHGGGEPTLEKNLIKKSVERVELIKGNKKTHFLITTNGTTDIAFLDWMIEKKFGISVSIDGPPEIQNRNRPFAVTLKGSSEIVERNIKHLVCKKYPFSVRVTYSPVDEIQKTIEYFGDLGVKKIHLEPLFPFGKDYNSVGFGLGSGKKVYSPNGDEILQDFFKAMSVAKKYGIKMFNGHLKHFTTGLGYFCGSACARSMTVTHDGFLTACLEVVDNNDKDKKNFFIGKFNKNTGDFFIDQKQIEILQKRHADNIIMCQKCYARYHCAGGCAIKAVRATGKLMDCDLPYCYFTKALVPKLVKKIAHNTQT